MGVAENSAARSDPQDKEMIELIAGRTQLTRISEFLRLVVRLERNQS